MRSRPVSGPGTPAAETDGGAPVTRSQLVDFDGKRPAARLAVVAHLISANNGRVLPRARQLSSRFVQLESDVFVFNAAQVVARRKHEYACHAGATVFAAAVGAAVEEEDERMVLEMVRLATVLALRGSADVIDACASDDSVYRLLARLMPAAIPAVVRHAAVTLACEATARSRALVDRLARTDLVEAVLLPAVGPSGRDGVLVTAVLGLLANMAVHPEVQAALSQRAVLERLLALARFHADDVAAARQAGKLVWNLAACSGEAKRALVDADALDVLDVLLDTWGRTHEPVAEAAIGAYAALVNEETAEAVGLERVVRASETVGGRAVVLPATRLARNFLVVGGDARGLLRHGVAKRAVQLVDSWRDDGDIVAAAVGLLARLLKLAPAKTRVLVGSTAARDALYAAAEAYAAHASRDAMRLLHAVACRDQDGQLRPNAVAASVAVARAHIASPRHLALPVRHLVLLLSRQAGPEETDQDVVALLRDVIVLHGHASEPLLHAATRGLCILLALDPDAHETRLAADSPALQVLYDMWTNARRDVAMDVAYGDGHFLLDAATVFWRLSVADEFASFAAAEPLVAYLVQLIGRAIDPAGAGPAPSLLDVQLAVGTLRNLATSDEVKDAVGKLGGVAVLARLVRQHVVAPQSPHDVVPPWLVDGHVLMDLDEADDEGVYAKSAPGAEHSVPVGVPRPSVRVLLEHAFGALSNLVAFHRDNKWRAVDVNLAPTVMAALDRLAARVDVLANVLALIGNASTGCDAAQWQYAALHAARHVLDVLERHDDDDVVLARGLAALIGLTAYCPSNQKAVADADGVRRVVGTIAASENADIVANALALLANLAGGASADAVQRDGGAAWAGDMLDVWMDDARICTNAACVLVNVGSVPSQRASEAVVSAQRMHGDDANASQILDAAARLAW